MNPEKCARIISAGFEMVIQFASMALFVAAIGAIALAVMYATAQ